EDEADITRSNTAAYLDLGLDITQQWFVGLAGRFEHYDDSSGNTWNGKITTRYEFLPNLAVRGTISTGFVAPSLLQQGYGTTTVGYGPDVNGIYANRKGKLVRPDSTLAQALGAKALVPTKSVNYSLGLTYSPIKNFNIAIDAYRIDLKDRIAQTSALSGTGINSILAANGFNDIQTVQYFANLFDTTTNGIDIVADYTQQLQQYGRIRWSLGFNYNKTKITDIAENPSELSGINIDRVGRAVIGSVTVANPRTKFTLGSNWQYHKFDINTRLSRYDRVILRGATAATDAYYGAKWIVDLDATYHVTDNLSFTLGADNLFNTFPDKTSQAVITASGDTSGGSKYPNISPFGSYGGYYYGRISYKF
ncbi:MAG: TonB-dependent receptor, partial [Acinetobacter sp.]